MASLTKYSGSSGKIFDVAKIKQRIGKALDTAAKQAKAEYQKTTATWEGQPPFTINRQGEDTRIVGTDSEVYGYVDHGTKPHEIRAVNGPSLAFQTGYTAKTTPGVIGSQPGGSFGSYVYPQSVLHPGTKAREFSKEIAKSIQPKLVRVFDNLFQDLQR